MIFSKRFWGTFAMLLITAFFVEGVLHFLPFSKSGPDPLPRWIEWPLAGAFFGAIITVYVQLMFESFVETTAEEVVSRLRKAQGQLGGDEDDNY